MLKAIKADQPYFQTAFEEKPMLSNITPRLQIEQNSYRCEF